MVLTFNLTEAEQRSIQKVEEILEYSFKDKSLLLAALTHRSYINILKKLKRPLYSYERLEFLGDSVLNLLVSEYLYRFYQELDEGVMSKVKSVAVNTKTLSEIIQNTGINRYIIMSRSEYASKGYKKPHILAAVYESILGALYMDAGLNEARSWVSKTVFPRVDEVIQNKSYYDPKTRLQEYTQQRWHVLPEYEVIKEEGADHAKTYTVHVKIQGNVLASGTGASKKEAEADAAWKALDKLYKQRDKIKDHE